MRPVIKVPAYSKIQLGGGNGGRFALTTRLPREVSILVHGPFVVKCISFRYRVINYLIAGHGNLVARVARVLHS